MSFMNVIRGIGCSVKEKAENLTHNLSEKGAKAKSEAADRALYETLKTAAKAKREEEIKREADAEFQAIKTGLEHMRSTISGETATPTKPTSIKPK